MLAVEQLFFNKNTRSAMAVGQARGVILLAAAEAGLEIHEFTPLEVKLAVTGQGRATKDQVGYMVKTLLSSGRRAAARRRGGCVGGGADVRADDNDKAALGRRL